MAPGTLTFRRPEPAPRVANVAPPAVRFSGSGLAAQGRLPLAFMVLGLVWLVFAAALLAARPGVLALPHVAPRVVALTHAWVLGFFVTVATGATYQLAPVALSTTLWSERLGWWHFGLQTGSVPGMVYAFSVGDMTLLGHCGAAFAVGIGMFTFNTWKTVRRSGRNDVVAWSLACSAIWLLLTVSAGLLVAANRFWHFIPLDPLVLLRAHAHLGVIGFFLTLLQGVTFQLLPMFTLGHVPNWRLVQIGFALSQVGLLVLVPALVAHAGFIAAFGGALVLGGIIASSRALDRTLATRKKRKLDAGLQAFLRGLSVLVLAAVVGLVLAWPTTAAGSAPGGLSAMVYGIIIFVGGLLPAIAGMMCKIVPFLTWMRAYGPKVGRVPTPSATALTRPRLESWGLTLQGVAVAPLVAGAWTLSPAVLAVGSWILASGIALFGANLLGVMSHLWRATPVTPAHKTT